MTQGHGLNVWSILCLGKQCEADDAVNA
jgi:hypothetical protein